MQSGGADTAEGGLASLLPMHRAELLRFLAARCGDRERAEDLLQELWIKAASLPSGPIANGRAYLFRMANNLVLDMRRTEQRAMQRDRAWLNDGIPSADLAPEDRPDPAIPADEDIARRQEAALLEKLVSDLPPGAQRALRLHRFEGHGQAEVAEIMGISRSGVEKHLAVAMKHLRNALANCGWFSSAASRHQEQAREEDSRSGQQP